MDAERYSAYLTAMQIQRWVPRQPVLTPASQPAVLQDDCSRQAVPQGLPESLPAERPLAADPVVDDSAAERWQNLRQQVTQCTACALHQSRTQTVFGVGHQQARLMVIGEAPGADEDRQGEPFVGKAGQLLTAMLQAIGIRREEVFIANILKCRPPNNRDPQENEVHACANFLNQQIDLVQPQVILSVGRISAQNLLRSQENVGKLRGLQTLPGRDIPVVVTYHPAYLLRQPAQKAAAWTDLKLLRSLLPHRS